MLISDLTVRKIGLISTGLIKNSTLWLDDSIALFVFIVIEIQILNSIIEKECLACVCDQRS